MNRISHFPFSFPAKISMVLFLFAMLSCRHEAEPDQSLPKPACLLTKMEWNGGIPTRRIIFVLKYNASGKLQAYWQLSPNDSVYFSIERDKFNRISRITTQQNNAITETKTITYNNQGQWTKLVYDNMITNHSDYFVVAAYNQEGLLTKTTTNFPPSAEYFFSTFDYTDGNLTKAIQSSTINNSIITNQYEYNLDWSRHLNEIDLIMSWRDDFQPPSKYLTKRSSSQIDTQAPDIGDYIYEMNNKGFPTKTSIIDTHAQSLVSFYTYQYQCE